MERVRLLTPRDRDAVKRLWELRFQDSPAFTDWFFDCRYRPESSVCLERDGEILSVMQGLPMRLRLRGATVDAMMVSGVSTLPGHEKQGLMHRTYRGMMQLCRALSIPVVFDKPAHLPTFFSLGHLPCTRTLYHTVTADGGAFLPSTAPDYAAMLACYQGATERYSGCVVRDEAGFALKMADYLSDRARIALDEGDGRVHGYCVAFEAERGLYAEELIAEDAAAYHRLLARLPQGSVAKLPPDLPFAGEIRPQNVIGVADVSKLLAAVVRDECYVFAVDDTFVPENCGVFDGLGRRTDRAPTHRMAVGELMQALAGYRALDERYPAIDCFCVDEY